MFDSLFPKHWTTLQRLMWLKTNALARSVYDTITGNPVSFTAKAAPLRQLEVAFSPVQSLNGYDAPWPAGGGKNLLRCSASSETVSGVTFTVNADGSIKANGTATALIAFSVGGYTADADVSVIYNGVTGGSLSTYSINTKIGSSYTGDVCNGDSSARSMTSGQVMYFLIVIRNGVTVTDLMFYPMIRLDAVSDATFAPYSNICPILGWDSLNVSMTGINIYDENDTEQGRINLNTGADNPTGNGIRSKTINPIKPNTTYMAIRGNVAGALAICYYDQAGTFLSYAVLSGGSFTTPATAFGFRLNLQTVDPIANPHDISINYPATDHDYHAYNPSSRSISISLGQTGYSGVLDVLTGVVTVTMASVDMGTLDWIYYGNLLRFATKLADGKPTGGQTPSSNVFCSQYAKFVGGYRFLPDDSIMVGSNFFEATSCAVVVHDETYTDAATFKTAMSGVQLVYELATPIPIQLTPQEVESLAGDNTLWSDANQPLTVTYRSN